MLKYRQNIIRVKIPPQNILGYPPFKKKTSRLTANRDAISRKSRNFVGGFQSQKFRLRGENCFLEGRHSSVQLVGKNLQTFKFDRSKETYDAAHKLIDNGTIVGCLKKCKNIQDIFRSLFRFKIF